MKTTYFDFFEVIPGTPQYHDYLSLRYDIFVTELGRVTVNPDAEKQKIEFDQFDTHSKHFLAIHRESKKLAACSRLILPNPLGLNVESRYIIDSPNLNQQNRENTGEISRMAIAPYYRRRRDDDPDMISGDPSKELTQPKNPNQANHPEGFRRQNQPELVFGMYREIYYKALESGIMFTYAAMDNRYSKLLLNIGFPFVAVGPVNVQVTPHRRPYIISQTDFELSLSNQRPEVLSFLTNYNS